MANTTRQDVVRWLRAQARELSDMAERLEGMDQVAEARPEPVGNSSQAEGFEQYVLENNDSFLLVRIRDHLKHRKMRISELAKEIGVSESSVERLMKPEHGFIRSGYGWFTYQKDSASRRVS